MTKPREQALLEPSERNMNACLKEWKEDEKNVVQEKALRFLFKKQYPDNTKIEGILLKVSALNDFYSTNIFDTYTVSKHIFDCNIDEELRKRDMGLVNKIASVEIGGKRKNFYSFASKYCSHHKPESYPIYDRYVDRMLWCFQKKDGFFSSPGFKRNELKKYERFSEIVKAFKRYYDPDKKFKLREIDIYLWSVGRIHFSKNTERRV